MPDVSPVKLAEVIDELEFKKYRRRPDQVEAVKWEGSRAIEVPSVQQPTYVYPGQYLVRDSEGSIHPYLTSYFENRYEPEPPDVAPDAPLDGQPTSDPEEVEVRKEGK